MAAVRDRLRPEPYRNTGPRQIMAVGTQNPGTHQFNYKNHRNKCKLHAYRLLKPIYSQGIFAAGSIKRTGHGNILKNI